MKLGLILRWLNPVFTEVVDRLRALGVTVDLLIPDDEEILNVHADLFLLKSGTAAGFALGGTLHEQGARIINPYKVVALLRNKLLTTRRLAEAGVRVPTTLQGTEHAAVDDLLAAGPIVVKPITGSRGEGVTMIHSAAELAQISLSSSLMVQRYHPGDGNGRDRKVFRIGDQLFGVERRWPLRDYADKFGRPFEVTGEMAEMAMKVGDALGIDLYGVDFVVAQGRPYAVDINKCGSFVGVVEGPRLLAEYLLKALG